MKTRDCKCCGQVAFSQIGALIEEFPNVRLLVVEDDKDLNRQIATALSQAGYAVDRAFDGEEGWFLGDTEPYDAVVLDLGLPKKRRHFDTQRVAQGRTLDAGTDFNRARSMERQGSGV
jgi:CheY-like chemotaxis protein